MGPVGSICLGSILHAMGEKRSDNFAARLQQARREAGLSQDALGEKLNVAERTIRHYEAGTKEPSLYRLPDIASVTGKPIGWFFEEPLDELVDEPSVETLAEPMDEPELAVVVVPLFDEVPADPIRKPAQCVQAMVAIPPEWLQGTATVYCLRMKGNSMEPVLLDKDIIVVRQQPDAEYGQIVVATLPAGEYVVKRLAGRAGEAVLESVNREHGPVVSPGGFRVDGRVVGVIREL